MSKKKITPSARYVPISENGKPIAFQTLGLWAMMCYAGDEASARSARDVLSSENVAMQTGKLPKYTAVGELIQKDMKKRIMRARMSGNVAIQVMQNMVNRDSADIGKAIYLVSTWGNVTKTVKGKSLPSDASALRKYFKEFRSVIHFWAAFELLQDDQQERLLRCEEVYRYFMLLSIMFEEFFDEHDCLPNWHPWRVPKEVVAALEPGNYVITLPPETQWVRDRLSEYRSSYIR